MAKSNTAPKSSGSKPLLILAAIGALGFAAFAAYSKFAAPPAMPSAQPRKPGNLGQDVVGNKPIPVPTPAPRKIDVLTPDRGSIEPKFHRETKAVPEGEDAWLMAVNGFLENSGIAPKDAKAVGSRLEDRTLILDFSASFRRTYGSADEAALLKGIQLSIGQFPEIDKVRFTVEGKPLDTLGNVDLSEPIDVLRKSDS